MVGLTGDSMGMLNAEILPCSSVRKVKRQDIFILCINALFLIYRMTGLVDIIVQ